MVIYMNIYSFTANRKSVKKWGSKVEPQQTRMVIALSCVAAGGVIEQILKRD